VTTQERAPLILHFGAHDFAVAVWARDEGAVPICRIARRDIDAATVAATIARQAEEDARG
jgi:hypothetical protein